MNFTKEKYNASSAKNAPEISSPIDLNELPRSQVTQNADVLGFTNMVNQMDSNLEDGRARADCIPTVNMLDPQVLPYKIHNTSGTLPRCHNTQIADLLRFRNMVNQTDENVSARADCMPAVNMLDPVVPPYQTTNGPLHSYNHFMMVDSDNASNGTSQSNQTTQSDRSLLSVRGNTPAGVQINSQGGAGTSTHSSPDTPMSDDIYRPRMVRDLVSVGTYMHAANQYHDNWLAMAGNHVRNAAQSNYLGFPGMDLDHGIGDEMVTPFPSNNHGGAGPCNNGRTVAPRSYSSHRPQADASFLSLGHDMGDVNLPTNNSGPMLGANAGTNSTSFSSFQTVQSDAQHFYPIHRSIIGVGGSADSRNGNINPYGGYHGYSSVAPRHLSGIQAPMLANEQARPVMIGQPSIIAAQDHNQLVSAQVHNQVLPAQQHYLNNLRSALNSYSMAPPFVGTMASTSQIDQSGHIAPARDVSVPQASKFSGRKGNMKEQAQPATNGTPRVSRKGKRGPTEASQYAQPAKVQVVPSVPPGKPVLLAARSGPKPGISITGSKLSRPSPVLVRPPKSGGLPPASATSFRSQKMIPQVSNPYPSSANQNTATYHLKCKFDEPIVSIGENCPICRRDLIFTPTGTVTQPSIPPPVAVLSCGHTFHDECLQNITPPEQSKNPPCIPCAIGKF